MRTQEEVEKGRKPGSEEPWIVKIQINKMFKTDRNWTRKI
jgi:hypothetical protein